jgi:hypothetical protein
MAGNNQRSWLLVVLVAHPSQIFLISQVCADNRINGPYLLRYIRADLTKENPKSGVIQMEWNLTGNLLLIRFGAFYELEIPPL